MNSNAIQELSIFAMDLALRAGEVMVQERQRAKLEHIYKSNEELVTNADLKVDELITKRIRKIYPEHRILSEESDTDKTYLQNLQDPLWIIDPIDGTVNYAHGHPQVAVSIAYVEHGEVQIGIVHNPFMEETFSAIRGQTATLNHKPIQVSGETSLRRALVATGFPYAKDALTPIVQRVSATLHHCRDIRRLGSAALDICWVACGRMDAYYESVSPWDFAAARLIALQAGATCGHFSSVPQDQSAELWGTDILISSPALFDPFREILVAASQAK
ncbi:MAG: inositol monophosphatase [Hahellaceae bacterium]|nr:inositol monophosphatase [Hahellaceae bacterium]MCP5170432.1 inositol monophosphatase [Hahellaceae bacterium]